MTEVTNLSDWEILLSLAIRNEVKSMAPHLDAMKDRSRVTCIDAAKEALAGSMDSAKVFHDAVAPDWVVTHAYGPDRATGEWHVNLTHSPIGYCGGKAGSMGRAWALAIIKAKIAELSQKS